MAIASAVKRLGCAASKSSLVVDRGQLRIPALLELALDAKTRSERKRGSPLPGGRRPVTLPTAIAVLAVISSDRCPIG